MTLLAATDRKVICRVQLTGEGRWVSLALSLGDLASSTRFLVSAERVLYEMAGIDEVTREYGFSNWQGGVISGARYAFRALKAPIQQVCLHELRGQLRSSDIWAVSSAAALAVARLLARTPEFPLDLGGWAMDDELRDSQSGEGISLGGNVGSSEPVPLPERDGNSTPLSENRNTPGATQTLPAEPGAAADLPGS